MTMWAIVRQVNFEDKCWTAPFVVQYSGTPPPVPVFAIPTGYGRVAHVRVLKHSYTTREAAEKALEEKAW